MNQMTNSRISTADGRLVGKPTKIAGIVAVAAALSIQAAFADQQLNAEQIRDLFSGSTLRMLNQVGDDVVIRMGKDKMHLEVPANNYTDTGTWWIDGDLWCREFDKGHRTKAGRPCHHIYHVEGNEYRAVRTGKAASRRFWVEKAKE